MKSTFILLFAATLCSTATIAQKNVDAPANLKAAFTKAYPGATKVKWEKEENVYEVAFDYKSHEMSVTYNADGSVAETETEIAVKDLPAAARKYAEAKGKIKEAAKIVLANGAIQYEAELKGKDLIFDEMGNFLKEKSEKKEDKD